MCLRPLLVVLSHLNILSQPGFKEIPCKVITTPAAVSQSPVDLISYLQSTVLLEIVVTLNFSVYMLNNKTYLDMGGGRAGGGTVSKCNALQAGRSRVRFPIVSLEFFINNPSTCTMALESSGKLIPEIFSGVKASGA